MFVVDDDDLSALSLSSHHQKYHSTTKQSILDENIIVFTIAISFSFGVSVEVTNKYNSLSPSWKEKAYPYIEHDNNDEDPSDNNNNNN